SAVSGDANVFEGRDDATNEVKWTGTRADLVFGSNSELRALAEVYASADAADKFVRYCAAAWVTVWAGDRYDLGAPHRTPPGAAAQTRPPGPPAPPRPPPGAGAPPFRRAPAPDAPTGRAAGPADRGYRPGMQQPTARPGPPRPRDLPRSRGRPLSGALPPRTPRPAELPGPRTGAIVQACSSR
ncbi:hypothetical protein R6G00_00740, partial [Streptomyces roseofulvus]|nr:hypothetical protein [Streptomyces roseolus]